MGAAGSVPFPSLGSACAQTVTDGVGGCSRPQTPSSFEVLQKKWQPQGKKKKKSKYMSSGQSATVVSLKGQQCHREQHPPDTPEAAVTPQNR